MSVDTMADLADFQLPARFGAAEQPSHRPPRHRSGEKFLKGPIPWNWLTKAAQQPGKALHVAFTLWFWAGIERRRDVFLSLSRAARELGTSRSAMSRGLKFLEHAALVSVQRQSGRKPKVTLLDAPPDDNSQVVCRTTCSSQASWKREHRDQTGYLRAI